MIFNDFNRFLTFLSSNEPFHGFACPLYVCITVNVVAQCNGPGAQKWALKRPIPVSNFLGIRLWNDIPVIKWPRGQMAVAIRGLPLYSLYTGRLCKIFAVSIKRTIPQIGILIAILRHFLPFFKKITLFLIIVWEI